MKQQKNLLWLISIFILSMILAGGGGDASGNRDSSGDGDQKGVGIGMPTTSSERWVEDGNTMVEQLEDLGYETDLQYAEDVVENQVSQIENMITKGVDVLVIASIDGEALTEVLEQAENLDIPVIAYD